MPQTLRIIYRRFIGMSVARSYFSQYLNAKKITAQPYKRIKIKRLNKHNKQVSIPSHIRTFSILIGISKRLADPNLPARCGSFCWSFFFNIFFFLRLSLTSCADFCVSPVTRLSERMDRTSTKAPGIELDRGRTSDSHIFLWSQVF